MAERRTLISRPSDAPRVAMSGFRAPESAFGVVPNSDASGLINLGRGIAQAGDAGAQLASQMKSNELRFKAREEQLLREQAARDDRDNHQKIENILLDHASLAQREINANLPTWGENVVDGTNSVIEKYNQAAQQKISELVESSPNASRVARPEVIKELWSRATNPDIERAYGLQSQAKVGSRRQELGIYASSKINLAGTDMTKLGAALGEVRARLSESADLVGPDFKQSFEANQLPELLYNSLQGAVIERGYTPDIQAMTESLHASSFLTTEQKARLAKSGDTREQLNRAEIDKNNTNRGTDLRNGNVPPGKELLHALEANAHYSFKSDEPARAKAQFDEHLADAAIGSATKRELSGEFIFPLSQVPPKDGEAPKGPTLAKAIDMLERNDRGEVRQLMLEMLSGYEGAGDYVARAGDAQVDGFRVALLKKLKDQQAMPLNLLAQNDPVVRGITSTEGATVADTMLAYKAWFQKNNIPEDRWVLFHQPHADAIKQMFLNGDRDGAVKRLREIATGYGHIGAVPLARGLLSDERTRPLAAAAYVLSLEGETKNERIQKGIQSASEKLLEAAFADIDEFKKGNEDQYMLAQSAVRRISLRAATRTEFSPTQRPKDYFRPPENEDQTMQNLGVTLSRIDPRLSGVFQEAVTKLAFTKAFGPGGTQDVVAEAQRAFNTLSTSMMLVRVNGTNAASPVYEVFPPDLEKRHWLSDMVMGQEAGQAVSFKENQQVYSQAIDAVFLQGIEKTKYGGLGIIGHLDNAIASSVLGRLGWNATGLENNSFEATVVTRNTDWNSEGVFRALNIDFANLVTGDGRPLAFPNLVANEDTPAAAEKYINERIKHSGLGDLRSINQHTLAQYRVLKKLPNGDLQVFMSPGAPGYENVPSGSHSREAPVYTADPVTKERKPLILSGKALKALIDTHLDRPIWRTPGPIDQARGSTGLR